jgi:hypothetical protein
MSADADGRRQHMSYYLHRYIFGENHAANLLASANFI